MAKLERHAAEQAPVAAAVEAPCHAARVRLGAALRRDAGNAWGGVKKAGDPAGMTIQEVVEIISTDDGHRYACG